MAVRADHQLAHEHARQVNVTSVDRLASDFIQGVYPDMILAYGLKVSHDIYPVSFSVAFTATMTDSITLEYPVQRQRLPP